jgi:hypothetical protein
VARLPVPQRLRRGRGENEAAAAPPPRPVVRRAASPGALRRERKAIFRAREELLRDLGGLAMEMYRREQFREDLLAEHAREIANLEIRLHELDSMLAAAAAGRRATTSRCECGAPIIWGSHFCANCGRPVGPDAVVACSACGHPLPADAEFCPSCGASAEPRKAEQHEPEPTAAPSDASDPEATVIRPAAAAAAAAADGGDDAPNPDRWEE